MEEGSARIFEGLAETTEFLGYFKELPDRRHPGKVIYPLDEILLLCLGRGAGLGGKLRRHRAVQLRKASGTLAVSKVRPRSSLSR
jgi:hypothetical protein